MQHGFCVGITFIGFLFDIVELIKHQQSFFQTFSRNRTDSHDIVAGLTGLVYAARLGSAQPGSGDGYEMNVIAACIIGGASFRGGKGTIWGTLLGALLISAIRNGLNLFSAGNDIQYIVIGSVIIVAVTIDVTRGKIEARARKMATV